MLILAIIIVFHRRRAKIEQQNKENKERQETETRDALEQVASTERDRTIGMSMHTLRHICKVLPIKIVEVK